MFFWLWVCTHSNTLRKPKDLWYQRIFVAKFLQAFLFPESLYYKDLWCSFRHPPCYLTLHTDEEVMNSWVSRLSHPLLTKSRDDPLFRLWMQSFLFICHLVGNVPVQLHMQSPLFYPDLLSGARWLLWLLGVLTESGAALGVWPGGLTRVRLFFLFCFLCVFLEHKHELWFKPLNFLELSRKIEYNKNIAQINVHVISDWCLLFSSWFGQFLTRMIVV